MSTREVIIRILLAVLIGGVVGFNREHENMPAGFRTHVLVCLGAATVSLIQAQLGYFVLDEIAKNQEFRNILTVDEGRVICQVVSGIGFLGAGTIIKAKGSVKGLTTAASVWAVGCVGIAIGMGFYRISLVSGAFIVICLVILKKFEDRYMIKSTEVEIQLQYLDKSKALKEVNSALGQFQIDIKNIKTIDKGLSYILIIPEGVTNNEIITLLLDSENIISVNIM